MGRGGGGGGGEKARIQPRPEITQTHTHTHHIGTSKPKARGHSSEAGMDLHFVILGRAITKDYDCCMKGDFITYVHTGIEGKESPVIEG